MFEMFQVFLLKSKFYFKIANMLFHNLAHAYVYWKYKKDSRVNEI